MQKSEDTAAAGEAARENRGKWTHVKCSLLERETWKAEAEAAGLTVADLIRKRMATKIEGREPVHKRPTRRVDPELIRAVSRIGNNLNQIARWANTHAEAASAAQVLAALVSIEHQVSLYSGPGARVSPSSSPKTSSSYRPVPRPRASPLPLPEDHAK